MRPFIVLGLVAFGTFSPACFSGSLGATCTSEGACPFGLACYAEAVSDGRAQTGFYPSICTIGCADNPCAEGVCLTTSAGAVCVRSCNSSADCTDGTQCQRDTSGAQGCWRPDPQITQGAGGGSGSGGGGGSSGVGNIALDHVRMLKGGVVTNSMRVGDDVRVELFGKNTGTGTVSQIAVKVASAATSPQLYFGNYCIGASATQSSSCAVSRSTTAPSSCACALPPTGQSFSHLQTLGPGATATTPMFIFDLSAPSGTLTKTYQLNVTFMAPVGASWNDTFTVQVTQ